MEYSQISIEFSIENKSEKTNQSKIKLKFKEFISFGLPDMKATQFCLTMIKNVFVMGQQRQQRSLTFLFIIKTIEIFNVFFYILFANFQVIVVYWGPC